MTDLDTQVVFDFFCKGGHESRLAYSRAVRYCWPVEDRHIPEFLYFKNNRKVKPSCRDAFKITDALLVCSPAFRDVLVQHDLGSTQLHEVPIYADADKTPSDLPPHYLLHVTEGKEGSFGPNTPRRSSSISVMTRTRPGRMRPGHPFTTRTNWPCTRHRRRVRTFGTIHA